MSSFPVLPGVLYDLLHRQVVLDAPIYARQECLLHGGINEFVLDEEVCESLVDQQMEGFADTATECDHSEVL